MKLLLTSIVFLFYSWTLAQNPDIEGLWIVCDSKNECEDDESMLLMSFDKGVMQLFLKISGMDPQKIGEQLTYEWIEGKLVVSKKGDLMKDSYIIKIEGSRMTMTHNLNGRIVYYERLKE